MTGILCLTACNASLILTNTSKRNTGHLIDFNNISVLDRATGCMDRLVKEAIEIKLNSENFNRDCGFTVSRTWYPTNQPTNQKAKVGVLRHRPLLD
jgi:hypothetical protein